MHDQIGSLVHNSVDYAILTPKEIKRPMARLYDSRKRILVTGGAGFLCSHLIDQLLDLGHEVLCADNLFTGTKRNLDHLHNHSRFEFMRHDITFPTRLDADSDARPGSADDNRLFQPSAELRSKGLPLLPSGIVSVFSIPA